MVFLSFEHLTHAEQVDDATWRISFADNAVLWSVNGGYIAAAALRVAGTTSGRCAPVTVGVDFLRPMAVGPAELHVQTTHSSRLATLTTVDFWQDDKLRAIARIWSADQTKGPSHDEAQMPLVPHPRELRSIEELMEPGEPPLLPFWSVLEQKPINRSPRERTYVHREYLRWFRFKDIETPTDRFLSMARTLPLIDFFGAASAAQRHDNPFLASIAPTAALSVHFRSSAYQGDWLLCEALCEHAAEGTIGAQAKIWGLNGELLAHGMTQMLSRPGTGLFIGGNVSNSHGTREPS